MKALCTHSQAARQAHCKIIEWKCNTAHCSVTSGALRAALRHRRVGSSRTPSCLVKATADGVQASAQSFSPTTSSVATTAGQDAVYVKTPIAPGAQLAFNSSVVVLADLPAGASIFAGGDVIVLGVLSGEAAAGCNGDTTAMVLASKLAPTAVLSVAGRKPAAGPPAGRDANLMLCIDTRAGNAAATFVAMPGSPPLPTSGAEGAEIGASKVARAASALAVLALGVGLVVAPGQVLGNLLSTSAESIAGALLDVFVFGYILLQGAGLLSDGSELLLEIVNPGIVGGVVLPVLGALPDSLIILTALNASKEQAQEQVAVGVGTLAGSTILLLSLAWGVSVILGRCDLNATGQAIDKKHTRGWDLSNTGVTVDRDVRSGAAIMAGSVLLYGTVQVPAFLGFSKSPQAALTGAVCCLAGMVAYCIYSVLYPQLQERRIAAARRKRFRMVAVKALAVRSNERYGSLVQPSGCLDPATVRSIFDEFDSDKSGAIDAKEVQGLLLGLQLAGGPPLGMRTGMADKETMDYVMQEFDSNTDSRISFDEFNVALSRWVSERLTTVPTAATAAVASSDSYSSSSLDGTGGCSSNSGRYRSLVNPTETILADLPADDLAALQGTAAELDGESPDEAAEDLQESEVAPLSTRDIFIRAVQKMGVGIALCAVFSDPLVEALTNLSRATGISPFVVGFVLTPLASNSSEFVSSLNFAARKRRKNMSLTLAQVYGAVTMNNTLVLGLFLLVVYLQKLEWVYSSEVTVIVAATLAVGALGFSRNTFKTWWALPAIALYPLSLAGVYVLDTFLGWR